jgi:N-acyl homoserine lactone hydrolase
MLHKSVLISLSVAWLAFGAPLPVHALEAVAEIRLYALDCGRADFKDMGMFADTGEYDGKPGSIADPCFLIRHPKGILLWDTGLGDKLAQNKAGLESGGIHLFVDVPLMDQLKALGLAAADINFIAFSHFHFDHTGNANAFAASTWIINKTELAFANGTPTPIGSVDPDTISGYKNARTQMIDGDYDVFGDGSVRILKAPGHTPGHQVLQLKLKKSGNILLSGDLYHMRDNRKFRRVPPINVERADTLASIDRIEAIIKSSKARLIIQHDPLDFKALPKFPAYLD